MALGSAGRTASVSRERHRARNLLVVGSSSAGPGAAGERGTDDSHVPGTANRASRDSQTRSNSKLCELRFHLSLIREARARDANAERHSRQAGGDSGSYVRGIRQRHAHGGHHRQLGHDVWRKARTIPPMKIPPLRLYKYVSPGFFHAAGTRLIAGRDLTWAEVYGLRHEIWFPTIWRARCGVRPRRRSASASASFPERRGAR